MFTVIYFTPQATLFHMALADQNRVSQRQPFSDLRRWPEAFKSHQRRSKRHHRAQKDTLDLLGIGLYFKIMIV